MEKQGKAAILVGGTSFPGFDSVEQAMEAIVNDPKFQGQGAVAVGLGGETPKSTCRKHGRSHEGCRTDGNFSWPY